MELSIKAVNTKLILMYYFCNKSRNDTAIKRIIYQKYGSVVLPDMLALVPMDDADHLPSSVPPACLMPSRVYPTKKVTIHT